MDHLRTPLVDLAKVGQETPTATLLFGEKDGRRERAAGMSHQAVGDHLLSLVVNDLAHLWPRAVWHLSERDLVGVLHMGAELDQLGFPIIPIMSGEHFLVLDLEQVFQLCSVWFRIFRQV